MSYTVKYTEGLDRDLNELYVADARAAALWQAVIDLIYDNDLVADELARNRTVQPGPPRFDTGPIRRFLNKGFNVSRIKLMRADGRPLIDQRLLYTVDYRTNPTCILLLGLMQRGVDYDLHDAIVARCLHDYDEFGVPRMPTGR